MKSDELRSVPVKNYIILGIVLVVTMLILYYFYMWVDVYKESKVNIPILDKYMTIINYNELDNYVVENPDTIVYVSVLENEEIREFEKKVKSKYKSKKINNDLLYMNITSELESDDIIDDMVSKYSLNSLNVTNVPCVLLFRNGLLKSIYSVRDNGYDVDRFVIYINNIDLESEEL
jgi:hypothetical protein